MIDKRDIELFQKAKKEQPWVEWLTVLSLLPLMLLIMLEVKGIYDYTLILVIISFVLSLTVQGGRRWISASREDLIKAMERMISNDPEALSVIAEQSKNKKQAH